MTTTYRQEQLFASKRPFIHLYTSPLETELLAEDDTDRTVILNMIALVSHGENIDVLGYALMNNHIHLILNGDERKGRSFYSALIKRLARYLAGKGKAGCLRGITCGITEITSLKQFRDELAYVIRNPFVVRDDVHLFSYRWCSGYLYFNSFIPDSASLTAEKITYRERRDITRSSTGTIPSGFRVKGILILPESFVNYKLVEALFGSARQFLYWTLKSVEAQVQVARYYKEKPMISDDELFILSRDLCERLYGTRQPKELTSQQKKEFSMELRNRYYASNGQLARLTSLPLQEVNRLYPLSAKMESSAGLRNCGTGTNR